MILWKFLLAFLIYNMTPIKKLFKSSFYGAFLILTLSSFVQPDFFSNKPIKWENIDNGIDLAEIDYKRWMNPGKIYGVKISNPKKLKILTDKNKSTSLESLKKRFNPLVIINGSFFDEQFNAVGLLKIDNKVVRKINKVGSSGILAIKNDSVKIFHKKEIGKYENEYNELMQNGPILVDSLGKSGIYSNDQVYSLRTAICINKENSPILIVTDKNASMSLWELSQLLIRKENKGGFNCQKAINLDGGSSTGIIINTKNKKIIVEEDDYIANAIGIF